MKVAGSLWLVPLSSAAKFSCKVQLEPNVAIVWLDRHSARDIGSGGAGQTKTASF